MDNINKFEFNEQEVRVLTADLDTWFLGIDVCRILEISNSGNACSRLKDYEKSTYPDTIRTMDGILNPDTVWISESGLYRLVLTSRKPQAEPFQDWVCQEVLPSIRKTGQYSVVEKAPTTAEKGVSHVKLAIRCCA